MPESTADRLARLPKLSKAALSDLWKRLFGKDVPPQLRRDLMLRILAHRLQEQAFGVLSSGCQRRLRQLAAVIHADPRASLRPAPLIKPGTRLVREWGSKTHIVHVVERGYEYNGSRYDSLSEIARLITGTRRSGPLFFGLKPKQARSSKEAA